LKISASRYSMTVETSFGVEGAFTLDDTREDEQIKLDYLRFLHIACYVVNVYFTSAQSKAISKTKVSSYTAYVKAEKQLMSSSENIIGLDSLFQKSPIITP
jgi:hypothetical protein